MHAGIKWAIVLLVILNLLQLNLLYFSSQGSTRCILKAALATRSASDPAVARSKSDTAAATTLPGNPLGSTVSSTVSRKLTRSEVCCTHQRTRCPKNVGLTIPKLSNHLL